MINMYPVSVGEPIFDDLLEGIQKRYGASAGNIHLAMARAVDLGLGEISALSKYHDTPPEERCKLVLEAYTEIIRTKGVPEPEKRAKETFSKVVSQKDDPVYIETWTKVLDG